jgi:hypothetical protein
MSPSQGPGGANLGWRPPDGEGGAFRLARRYGCQPRMSANWSAAREARRIRTFIGRGPRRRKMGEA